MKLDDCGFRVLYRSQFGSVSVKMRRNRMKRPADLLVGRQARIMALLVVLKTYFLKIVNGAHFLRIHSLQRQPIVHVCC